MHAVLLRRMMVLGVCALGVSALYLVPGLGGSSGPVGVPAPTSEVGVPSGPAPDSASVAARSALQPATVSAEDTNPPEPVTALTVREANRDQVRVAWAPSTDDTGTIGYKVWLNGYEVRSTSETEVTLDWFNDDSSQQVVVVRAVDAAGNQSRTGAALVLTRPAATPTAGLDRTP